MVLLDGNVVNINRLKKLNISRVDKLFKVRIDYKQRTYTMYMYFDSLILVAVYVHVHM